MTRFIIYMLLFIVIFLSGIIVGINKDHEQVETPEIAEILEEDIDEALYINQNNDNQLLTQKFAYFFEKIVSTIYNVIISAMYMIAKIFTG